MSNGDKIVSADFVFRPLPIVSLSHVVIQPEERSKNDDTSTFVASMVEHSTYFVRMDLYKFSPRLDNLASVSNQTLILLDDGTQLKTENPIMIPIDPPMMLVEMRYTLF
jgi:hypothetical protein